MAANLIARLLKAADWERDDPYGSGDDGYLRQSADLLTRLVGMKEVADSFECGPKRLCRCCDCLLRRDLLALIKEVEG